MASDNGSGNALLNGLGTLLGYIGAEAPTRAIFEQLNWPQRSYSCLQRSRLIQQAFLLPAGGPLYKASLEVLDTAFHSGLMRGRNQGHMLGTSFFPDTRCQYSLHSSSSKWDSHTESSRNNLWIRTTELLAFPRVADDVANDDPERASAKIASPPRARFAVRHLTLKVKTKTKDSRPALLEVGQECSAFSWRAIAGVMVEESTGIIVAVVVSFQQRSAFALLWVMPLLLKLLSVTLALRREPLDLSQGDMQDDEEGQDFEIDLPAKAGAFLIITGPPGLVLQFFRHYGHPRRSRFREVAQLCVVSAFGILFPFQLLCSVLWMPLSVQYIWLAYQMYVVGMMYISRYLGVKDWASTEFGLARLLESDTGGVSPVLWADDRNGKLVEGSLQSEFFPRYREGEAHVRMLLGRKKSSQETNTALVAN